MHFGCTACGRCCHGLRLTLTIAEAVRWIERGGTVEILCDASPINAPLDEKNDLRRERVFAARSGSLDIGIDLLLVASFPGPCPNLRADMRCGIYDERPTVCRVYPAEMTPGRVIDPAERRCPPEAWELGQPLIADVNGTILDGETAGAVDQARRGLAADAWRKEAIAAALGVDVAALRNEGFAVWTIPPAALLDALRSASRQHVAAAVPQGWRMSSNRAATRDLIAAAGAVPTLTAEPSNPSYLPFFDEG